MKGRSNRRSPVQRWGATRNGQSRTPSRAWGYGENAGIAAISSIPTRKSPTTDLPVWPAFIAYVSSHRNNVGTGFLALSLVGNLMLRSFDSPLLLLTWTALALGVVFTRVAIGNKKVFWSLVVLLAFHSLGIPGSILWGTGNWELTAGVVLWMAPAILLYLACDAQRVFVWLIPAFLVHAGLVIYQGLNEYFWADTVLDGEVLARSAVPAVGLANNANLAAGFLIFGIIYLLTSQRKWLSLPLLVALVFTGSRWGMIVAPLLLAIMAISGAVSWRPLAGAVAAMVAGVILLGMFEGSGYRVAGYGSITSAAHAAQTDIGARLAVPHLPSFLPSGVAEHPGLHNVPLRIAVENGVLAAALWILITGVALSPIRLVISDRLINRPHRHRTKHDRKKESERESCPKLHRLLLLPFRWSAAIAKPSQSETNKSQPCNQREIQDQTCHQRDKRDQNIHRWILLALILLSVLDYYTWMGHLGGFWWLLIGLLTKGRTQSDARPRLHIP